MTDWLKRFRTFIGWDINLQMRPNEAKVTLQYLDRLEHLCMPNPSEGEATKARSHFLLRHYSGKREILWANTETRELAPLSFLASYRGHPERYPDLEIGSR